MSAGHVGCVIFSGRGQAWHSRFDARSQCSVGALPYRVSGQPLIPVNLLTNLAISGWLQKAKPILQGEIH